MPETEAFDRKVIRALMSTMRPRPINSGALIQAKERQCNNNMKDTHQGDQDQQDYDAATFLSREEVVNPAFSEEAVHHAY